MATRWIRGAATLAALLLVVPHAEAQERLEKRVEKLEGAVEQLRQQPPACKPGPSSQPLLPRVARLEQDVSQLKEQQEEREREKLLADAEAEARAPEDASETKERTFLMGSLALQKLNPEISVGVDFVAQLVINDSKFYAGAHDRTSMPLREVSLHFQHVLDPYSRFKSAIAVEPGGHLHLEEAYIDWFGVLRSFSLTVGRFRHSFGIVNRWHLHSVDQVDYPLGMRLVIGDEGLAGSGASLRWMMPPLTAHANELTLSITDGDNEELFAGEHFTVPTVLAHLKNYYDLSKATYLELGLSGMFGFNNRRGYPSAVDPTVLEDESWRPTVLGGADLTIRWNPLREARYRSLTWRTELYYARKQLGAEGSHYWHQAWGGYSYLDYQVATQWFAGVRGDLALPTIRADEHRAWGVSGYLTFWQSEFVVARLQYSYAAQVPMFAYDDAEGAALDPIGRRDDQRVLLQVNWAAGPHKHERY